MTHSSVRTILLLACAGTLAPAAAAQEADTIPEPLDAVVVTVTRTERRVSDLPVAVTVVQRRDLELSGATNVADFIRQIPGVSGRRAFSGLVSNPGTSVVTLRGLGGTSSSRTLVLLDGMPVLGILSSQMQWGRIPMEHVERVEIVRGGGAGIWGNRAMGGVINIITRDPTATEGRLVVRGGELNTFDGTAAGSYAGPDFGVLALVGYLRTDGHNVVRADLRGPVDENVRTQNRNYYAKASWAPSSATTLQLDASYFSWDRDGETPLTDYESGIGAVRARLSTRTDAGHGWTVAAHAARESYSQYSVSVSRDRTTVTPRSDEFDVPASAVGARVQWAGPTLAGHDLTAGADVEWTGGESNARFDWSSSEEAFTHQRTLGGDAIFGGIYAQDSYRASNALQLFGGVRLSYWGLRDGLLRESVIASGDVTEELRPPDRSVWTGDFNLGFRFRANENVAWRAMAFSGFRAPTLNELYLPFSSRGDVIGAPTAELVPERLIGVEAGADVRVSNVATIGGTVYWSRVTDAIGDGTMGRAGAEAEIIEPCGLVPAGYTCRQRQNFGAFQSLGLELDVDYRPTTSWGVSASYSLNPTEVTEAQGQPELIGLTIPRVPEHQAKVRVSYANPSVATVGVTGRYLGTTFDDDLNENRIDDSFLVDMTVSRRVADGVEAFVEADNVFDTAAEVSRSSSGFVRIGLPRVVQGGLRIRF